MRLSNSSVFSCKDGVREHARNHEQQELLTETFYKTSNGPNGGCDSSCVYHDKDVMHYHCSWVSLRFSRFVLFGLQRYWIAPSSSGDTVNFHIFNPLHHFFFYSSILRAKFLLLLLVEQNFLLLLVQIKFTSSTFPTEMLMVFPFSVWSICRKPWLYQKTIAITFLTDLGHFCSFRNRFIFRVSPPKIFDRKRSRAAPISIIYAINSRKGLVPRGTLLPENFSRFQWRVPL